MPNWRGLLDSEPINKFLYDPASSKIKFLLQRPTYLELFWASIGFDTFRRLLLSFENRTVDTKIGLFDEFWWQQLGLGTTIVCSVERRSFWWRRAATVLKMYFWHENRTFFGKGFGDDDHLQRGATIVFERRMFLKRRKIGLFDVKIGPLTAIEFLMSFDNFFLTTASGTVFSVARILTAIVLKAKVVILS